MSEPMTMEQAVRELGVLRDYIRHGDFKLELDEDYDTAWWLTNFSKTPDAVDLILAELARLQEQTKLLKE